MLFRRAALEAIAAGTVTLAFRRWASPTVKAGTRLRTAAGVVEIEAVAPVSPEDVSAEDAGRAGFATRDALFADLRPGEGRALYRVALRWAGDDPREALRADDALDGAARAALRSRLDRIDAASAHGPWSGAALRLIAERPGAPARELAASLGVDKQVFKARVRKLKELGLTDSLKVGYRLSPRGRTLLS